MEVKANIISRPQIEYKGKASVEDAQWNLIDRKPHNAPSTGTWTLLELYRHGEKQNPETVKKFFEEFDAALKAYSMSGLSSKAGQMKQVVIDQKSPELTRENFRKEINELTKSSEHEFTVVLLPERDQDLYAMVKDVADRELGHVTACCVRKKGEIPTSRPTLASIIMKINLKLNKESVDRKIKSLSTYKLLDGETMIVGMDVVSGNDAACNTELIYYRLTPEVEHSRRFQVLLLLSLALITILLCGQRVFVRISRSNHLHLVIRKVVLIARNHVRKSWSSKIC